MATAEFSKFADILSATLSQHFLLGFEIAQLDEVDLRAYAGFLVREAGACPLVGSPGSCPSCWQWHVKKCA